MERGDDIIQCIEAGYVVFDGGLGSMLIAQGLPSGHPPEEWNLSRPDSVGSVHRAYRSAGADVVTTNTFGATPARLERHGLAGRLGEINQSGVRLARRAVGSVDRSQRSPARPTRDAGDSAADRVPPGAPEPFVALSVGPTGMMLPPVGDATETSIAREFEAQLGCVSGGFDLVLIETMFDVREGLIALNIAREVVDVPVGLSITFNKTPRGFFTVMGDEAAATARRIEAAGADIIAANCSIGSGEMIELARILRTATDRPVLCQPNAGQPRMQDSIAVYDQTPVAFADDAMALFEVGINAVGGCCGTTPDFIRELDARRHGHSRI